MIFILFNDIIALESLRGVLFLDKPKTIYDRVNRKHDKYIFISYSHRDCDVVFPLLDVLYNKNVNFWYDTELSEGDVWNKKVANILTNKDCVGIIFFMSKNSIASNAVHQEIILGQELLEKNENFRILPVLLGFDHSDKPYGEILNAAISLCDYDLVADIQKLFDNGKRLFLSAESFDLAEDIAKFCKKNGASEENYVETRDSHLASAEKFGSYPFGKSGMHEPIEFLLFNRENSLFYYVSKYCLDFVNHEEALNITKETFNLNDDAVIFAGLIDEKTIKEHRDIIGRAIPCDYADLHRTQSFRTFWVRDDKGDLVLYNAENERIDETPAEDNSAFTAGIRLLLIVNDDLLIDKSM